MIEFNERPKRLATLTALGLLLMSLSGGAFAQEVTAVSLDEALARALRSSPRLESSSAAIRASEGDQRQAGAWQNPQLTIEAENFSGDGPYNGYSGAETTFGVSQQIELSGKPLRRADVAKEDVNINRLNYSTETLTLASDVRGAYADAVAAQERLTMAREQKVLAKKLYGEVSARVDAAREPDIQKSKAEITLSTATFAEETALRDLNRAKETLASLWGGKESAFDLTPDYFFTVEPPMDAQAAEAALEQSAYLKRMTSEEARMRAVHRLEQIQAVPDPTVGLGMRDFRETGDRALIASVSLPLPVLNHNRGGIDRARENVTKAASDTHTMRIALGNELRTALKDMTNAHDKAKNLKSSVLPAAEKAFSQSRKGYNAGKFPYIEVLDAQRTLFDVKAQYINTLNDYHQAKATVDKLTSGEPQNQTQINEETKP